MQYRIVGNFWDDPLPHISWIFPTNSIISPSITYNKEGYFQTTDINLAFRELDIRRKVSTKAAECYKIVEYHDGDLPE